MSTDQPSGEEKRRGVKRKADETESSCTGTSTSSKLNRFFLWFLKCDYLTICRDEPFSLFLYKFP